MSNDNFHTFIITHSSERPLVWSSSAEEIQAFMDWQNEYLQDYQQNRKQWMEKLPESLRSLVIILHIDEIINYLPSNCDQLILIPHRFLHLIPLHALPLSENSHLLDRFSRGVRYVPSCQLLQLTEKQLCLYFNRLLAIQNPTKDLGHSAVEVKSIQNCFAHADTLIEDAATKAAIVEVKNKDDGTREVIQNSQLSLANCVHFSCHAEFNFEFPLKSALLLANEERITLGEIFDLDLSQCCLVTLSACETGLTNYKILSDEYIGIPSSFIYAGSPSVVSSLWTVQDVSTAFLMIKFYQNLGAVLSVAAALNQAQIWLRNISKKELQIWIAENKIGSWVLSVLKC
ncbi:MAG: CHAT domain-containing protein [Gloeotrichia echinulata HAB0833]